jgi:antitoxin (DNA-binding transcriptional repressor) of toxin-antitoxin stability system
MKTATVRDLRNHFADVAKWIEHGEAVTITRNGTAFATLAPTKAAKPRKVDWATRLAKRPPLGRGLSEEETNALWSRLRD